MTTAMDRILSELDHRHPFMQASPADRSWPPDPDHLNQMLESLHSAADPRQRLRAIVVLAWAGDLRAVDALMECLGDTDPLVRGWAAWALGILCDRQAVGPLVARLADDDLRVAEAAALALGRIGDGAASEPLISQLDHDDTRIRVAAAEALGMIGDPAAVEPLIRLLTDHNSAVRETVCRVLGQTADPRAAQPLVARLADFEQHVRTAAEVALTSLGAHAVAPLTEAVTTSLRLRPGQSHPWEHAGKRERMAIRRAAMGVLMELIPRVVELQGQSREQTLQALRNALPTWRRASRLFSLVPATVKRTLSALVQVAEDTLRAVER